MNNNPIYYIFGTGPSIDDITDEEWDFLKDKHTISMSTFPFSGKPLESYYSHERIHLDGYMLKIMRDYGYLNTCLYLSHRDSILYAKSIGFKYIFQIIKGSALFLPSRKPWCIGESAPPHKFNVCRAHTFSSPIFRFRGQLSGVINLALILGANEIRLIGVDLNSSRSFWETDAGMKRWIHTPEQMKIAIELYNEGTDYINAKKSVSPVMKDFNEDTMHVTEIPYSDPERWGEMKFRGMSDVLEWMNNELVEEGKIGIFTTNQKSIPFVEGKLKYKSIMED